MAHKGKIHNLDRIMSASSVADAAYILNYLREFEYDLSGFVPYVRRLERQLKKRCGDERELCKLFGRMGSAVQQYDKELGLILGIYRRVVADHEHLHGPFVYRICPDVVDVTLSTVEVIGLPVKHERSLEDIYG